MPGEDPETIDVDTEVEAEVLLRHYEQMREETRLIGNYQDRRILTGIVAIAAVAGSVFVSRDALVLVGFIPVLVWILVVREIESLSWLIRIEGHIIDIQRRLAVKGFDWEQAHGAHSKRVPWGVSIPMTALGVFVALTYVVTAWLGVIAVQETPIPASYGIENPALILIVLYVGLALLAGIVLWSFTKTLDRVRRTP